MYANGLERSAVRLILRTFISAEKSFEYNFESGCSVTNEIRFSDVRRLL